ncbi:hypothetical protein [Absidia glauca]|uniref:Uncharacterized protein n=1 Tax=Absidia glauca TaxID=4829 RepID=A0A168SSF4_ABSGL|nr:hypothetical protein [Absidia glauca]
MACNWLLWKQRHAHALAPALAHAHRLSWCLEPPPSGKVYSLQVICSVLNSFSDYTCAGLGLSSAFFGDRLKHSLLSPLGLE